MADDRWLVVGLGNPGERYQGTRHNVGADVVRSLAARAGGTLKTNKRVRCEIAEATIEGAKIVLAVPTSYMNRSGGPVQSAAAWYKVADERVVVCHDDVDLEVGVLRLKRGGGTGGHRGLDDIDRALGSRDYLRVRVGVGRPPGRMSAKDHVLRRFTPAEREVMATVIEDAGEAALGLVIDGLEPTQNRYHAAG
ncbi:MAG: aminoacyl-tRNA hydrolase [Nitriliruptoraceae bacterium]